MCSTHLLEQKRKMNEKKLNQNLQATKCWNVCPGNSQNWILFFFLIQLWWKTKKQRQSCVFFLRMKKNAVSECTAYSHLISFCLCIRLCLQLINFELHIDILIWCSSALKSHTHTRIAFFTGISLKLVHNRTERDL